MGMKVFLPVGTSQNLSVMPRANASEVDLTIRQELKDVTTVFNNISTSFSDGYLTIPFSHPFVEGETYELTVTDSSDGSLLWRGRGFVTSQTPQNYKENV